MLRQNITQKQTQKILPKIVLNQNILAIPALALDNLIKRELELNPMLEEGAETDTDQEKLQEEITEPTQDSDPEEETFNSEDEYNWDEYFENETDNEPYYQSSGDQEFDRNNIKEEQQSMYDNLIVQLHLCEIPNRDIFTGEEIIWSLDNDGYFKESIETVLEDLNVKKINTAYSNSEFTEDDILRVLEYIQMKLDPPGIAARDLRECIIIQVKRSDVNERMKDLTIKIFSDYFEDLKHKRFEKLAKELDIKMDDVKEIFEFIHKFNPKPYSQETGDEAGYITPDIIVKKIDDKYEIYLNEKFTPSLRINRTYRDMYSNRKKNMDRETKEYLVNNFNKAKWFIDAINSRRDTMIKIMEAIISRQKEFFDNNGEGLKPVFEKDIAEDIKMDTSTISRAVKGKYVQTDFGIYNLRSFFSNSIAKNDGSGVSSIEVRNKIKDIIDGEDKSNPLTDLEISAELAKSGIRIARRTVAKYRESIDLPIAKQRREIIN
ncbi:MAG: RNA polymerase factor sigma-54 [Bacteroidetes bacterium]|nr:RNA polymerase factor sigma-54 [Bacteroidota bacterium]